LGTPIYSGDVVNGGLQDGTKIGTLAYNSWIAMQNAHETDANTCAYNDLALIKIDPPQVANVNPTVPFWGGPDGLAPGASAAGSQVFTYGNSILRGGVSALSPKTGASLGDVEGTGGWSEDVYTVSPGIPGDSGSAYMDSNGDALGVLSTVQFAPLAGANGVGTLAKELAYANNVTGLGLTRRQGHDAVQLGPGSAGVLRSHGRAASAAPPAALAPANRAAPAAGRRSERLDQLRPAPLELVGGQAQNPTLVHHEVGV
jgi:hypothetical protein